MITKGLFTSNTPEWATPQGFFDKLDAEFHFTVDPCSTHENAKCEKHFTIEDDGLAQNLGGGKSFTAIHLTAKSCQSGLKNVMMKPCLIMQLLSCLFLPGLTQLGFMITSMVRQR